MGFNPFKAAKKAVKKITKSDLGKLALMYGAYQYGPLMFKGANPEALRGLAGWQKAAPAWLYSADASGRTASTGILADIGSKWRSMGPLGKAATVGAGIVGADKLDLLPKEKPDVPDVDDTTGHADYIRSRKGYLAEWAEWKAEQEGISYEEALADLEANPMFSASQGGRVGYNRGQFVQPGPGRQRYGGGARGQAAQNLAMEIAEDDYNQDFYDLDDDLQHKIYTKALQIIDEQGMAQGGRVKAQGGLFAGQMPGRHPGMNQMNQGLGAPNLGSRSMGMTPGMDPRMAQMMQGQGRGRPRTAGIPKESEDTELIQLIKMLTSIGFPMEQLRGRTKEELVEMLVAVKGKMGGGEEVVEEDVEEEVVEAAQGGRIGYANGGVDDWYREYIARRNQEGAKYNPSRAEYERHLSRPIPMGGTMPEGGFDEIRRQRREQGPAIFAIPTAAAGGGLMRTGYALGHDVIPSKDGMQLDMRDSGGYQPHGKAEKHDDVRALLAQGEFVMTSDAVKGMGGGDREMGAKKMYNLMHNMEAIA